MAKTDGSPASEAQAGIQSIEVAGEILRAILACDRPQRLSDIAQAAGMPAAKVHRYLVSLVRSGLCAQDELSGRYDLGPMAMQIGLQGFGRFDALRAAAETLDRVAEQVGETAALVVWGEHGPKFVRMIEARHAQASVVPVTHVCPLTWSATGLLFSTYEEPTRTRALILREIEQNSLTNRELAPKSEAELAALTARIRKAGVATVADGGGTGIAGISAPIFDVAGKLAMGLSVFGRSGRLDTDPQSPLVQHVRAATAAISRVLGFTGSPAGHQPAATGPSDRPDAGRRRTASRATGRSSGT
ncbi:Glycerol operon regulatory protein [bacterium YEK0313]|nr:Glycerol operon regulatory protein [bacterium YEK0313]